MSGSDHTPSPEDSRAIDLFASLRGYKMAWLPADIGAGLAIAAVGLPSAIAYPAIAGLPPETGIYASIASVLAYSAFGMSSMPEKPLASGPRAKASTMPSLPLPGAACECELSNLGGKLGVCRGLSRGQLVPSRGRNPIPLAAVKFCRGRMALLRIGPSR